MESADPSTDPGEHQPRTAPLAPWRRLGLGDFLALAVVAQVTLAVGLPRLPPGVCVADAGDLQLAAKVLGIPHPPGYAAYVSLAYLATLIPGVDSAVAVSVLCLVFGVIALLLTALIAIRLGANPFVGGAVALALTAHPRVWMNLTTPEIYIFSIAFSLAATYLMLRFLALGRSGDLLAAAFLLGVAIANRPPIIFVAPFFLWAWWKSPWRIQGKNPSSVRRLTTLVVAASLPGVYSLAYFYVRDNPSTAYNYVEQHNNEARELPEISEGFAAKVRRVIWLASAEQFKDHVGNDWKRMRTKLRWLSYETFGREWPLVMGLLVLTITGAVWLSRKEPRTAAVVVSWGVQAFLYRLIYRDDGQAADMLPLLVCVAVLAALGVTFVARPGRGRWVEAFGFFLLTAAVIFTFRDAPDRPDFTRSVDATKFLSRIDLESLPQNAVVLSYWTHAPPLRYQLNLLPHRADIDIVVAQPMNWPIMADRYAPRPVYATTDTPALADRRLTPEGVLFRIGPIVESTP